MKKALLLCSCFLLVVLTAMSVSAADETHIHQYTDVYTVDPTCTQEGFTYCFCSCGEEHIKDKTQPYGHDYSKEYIVIKEPTCVETGLKGRYCVRCYSSSDESVIDKITHIKENVTFKATMEKDGEKRISCVGCGQIYKSEKIPSVSSVTLNKSVFTYNRKNQRPSVKVADICGNMLVKDKDFTVEYVAKSKIPGKYAVVVTFTGDYEGEKILHYSILPLNVKRITAEPSTRTVYLSWNKVKGADGYAVYLYKKNSKNYILIKETDNLYYTVSKADNKRIDYGTDYCFAVKAFKNTDNGKIYSPSYKKISVSTKPSKSYLKSCRSSSDGSVTLNWKKQNCDGYELVYADNKSFSSEKKITVKSEKASSKAVKGLKSRETYYFKIRAYKTVKGEKVYGFYSDVLSLHI